MIYAYFDDEGALDRLLEQLPTWAKSLGQIVLLVTIEEALVAEIPGMREERAA